MTSTEERATRLIAPVGTSTSTEEAPLLVHGLLSKLVNEADIGAAVSTYSQESEHTV